MHVWKSQRTVMKQREKHVQQKETPMKEKNEKEGTVRIRKKEWDYTRDEKAGTNLARKTKTALLES